MNIAPRPLPGLVALVRSVLDELYRHAGDAAEGAAEIQGEHLGECRAFGDSWPGACLDVERAQRGAKAAEAAVVAYRAALDGLGLLVWAEEPRSRFAPWGTVPLTVDGGTPGLHGDDDIPF